LGRGVGSEDERDAGGDKRERQSEGGESMRPFHGNP
jgi:hypothetical protein